MAMGDGRHMLPVKVQIRRAIGKEVGKTVQVVLKKWIRNNNLRELSPCRTARYNCRNKLRRQFGELH
jgi:hypothetical protein